MPHDLAPARSKILFVDNAQKSVMEGVAVIGL
jgi:hypothetical protein